MRDTKVTVVNSLTRHIGYWPGCDADSSEPYLALLDKLDDRAACITERLYDAVFPQLSANLQDLQERSYHELSTLKDLAAYVDDGSDAATDSPHEEGKWSIDEFAWRPATTSSTLALLRCAVFAFAGAERRRETFLADAIDKWAERVNPVSGISLDNWAPLVRKLMDGEPWERLKRSSGMRSDDDLEVVLGQAAQALGNSEFLRNGFSIVFRDYFFRFYCRGGSFLMSLEVPFLFNVREPLELSWEELGGDGAREAVPPDSMLFVTAPIDSRVGDDYYFDATTEWVNLAIYKTADSWFVEPPPSIDLKTNSLNLGELVRA